ncbi:Eukaryotic peptide chain release factor GTP-binding subunit ERF3A-like protein [Dinothrombium tinctorium]|uniref:Eukaryotic peptide chain release factor GTP-binding subunit ERF3A-like protein n=1 Tax=Dinothrombium tinctorium TaxID=1965070 RepID=A0A443R9R5_9ACAR|nr:Eukaryotic peptide chain release factor GTP-binding subunit ERF3A-like protein [Dinothrombium tinctorium]
MSEEERSAFSNKNNVDSLTSSFVKKLNVDAPVFVPSNFSPSAFGATVKCEEKSLKEEKGEEKEEKEDASGDLERAELKAKAKKKRKGKKLSESSDGGSKKEHVNIVFIGHVDAGKSTIGGQLLFLTGMVDKRTLEKYEREAKEKNRESWYLSWALDTNPEERDKGKTVEVGRAYFETEHKHFTLLDAPGHRGYVSNMIGGATQADLAVLVISARKGEFETGFERGGQTREHAMLAKTTGVKHMVVLINKMDDPTVEWKEERYNECKEKLLPYLKKCGFNPKTELYFLPCSGLTGANLREHNPDHCPWYSGPTFLEYIDNLPSFNRQVEGPFRMPIIDKYKDMGTVVLGKVESGGTRKGSQLLLMPNRKPVEVLQLWSDEDDVNQVNSGENVRIKLKGVEEEEVSAGFVLCDVNSPCNVGKIFDAQVAILEHKSIICPGYSAVLHIHAAVEEVIVKNIICLIDKKTGEKIKNKVRFVKQDQLAIMRLECVGGLICMETFKEFQQMGRFTLRDEGKTIAIGKVMRVVE